MSRVEWQCGLGILSAMRVAPLIVNRLWRLCADHARWVSIGGALTIWSIVTSQFDVGQSVFAALTCLLAAAVACKGVIQRVEKENVVKCGLLYLVVCTSSGGGFIIGCPLLGCAMGMTCLTVYTPQSEIRFQLLVMTLAVISLGTVTEALQFPIVARSILNMLPFLYEPARLSTEYGLPELPPSLWLLTVLSFGVLHLLTAKSRHWRYCVYICAALVALGVCAHGGKLSWIVWFVVVGVFVYATREAGAPEGKEAKIMTLGVWVGFACLLGIGIQEVRRTPETTQQGIHDKDEVAVLESSGMNMVYSSADLQAQDAESVLRGPQFQVMRTMLEANDGPRVRLTKEVARLISERTRSIVLVNAHAIWDATAIRALTQFVEEGGRLLVLGDHTDLRYQASRTNPALRTFGIQLRHDSAIPDDSRWDWRGHQLRLQIVGMRFSGLGKLLTSIGCSLEIREPAVPLVIGTRCFADAADKSRNDGNFLGDTRWNRGTEDSGPLVLAAHAQFGAGEVLVFGDTSAFQNLSLAQERGVVQNVIRWLRGQPLTRISWVAIVGFGVCLIALSMLLWRNAVYSAASLSAGAGATLAVAVFSRQECDQPADALLIPPCPYYETIGADKQHSLTPLLHGISSMGVSIEMRRPGTEAPEDCAIAVEVLDLGQWTREDFSRHDRMLAKGGALLVLVEGIGHYDTGTVNPRLGMALGSEPIAGDLHWVGTKSGMVLSDTIGFELIGGDTWETLATCLGRPVIAVRPFGGGTVVVAGVHSPLDGALSNMSVEDLQFALLLVSSCLKDDAR